MSKVTMWRSRWRCVIKPAYSVSFLLSLNIFVWQNVLYFPKDLRTSVFMYNIRYSWRILIKLEFCRLFVVIFSNVEFHENPPDGNRVVPRGQRDVQTNRQKDGITDRRSDITTLIVASRNFANSPKNFQTLSHILNTGLWARAWKGIREFQGSLYQN